MSYPELIHDLCDFAATQYGQNTAVAFKDSVLSFEALAQQVQQVAAGLQTLIEPGDRVALYLPKLPETVIASFAISAAGGVLVPINPVLKAAQVDHILSDSGAKVLISQQARLASMQTPTLKTIAVDQDQWQQLQQTSSHVSTVATQPDDLATLLYTSGSTGLPKGVMLSHKNLVLGAISVAEYLELNSDDRILAVLPFSFDYGFNQLLSAVLVGAQTVLLDYLLPKDIVNACERYRITGLAGVPPLWVQLATLSWPEPAVANLRYFTNSGGHLASSLLAKLRQCFTQAQPVLMYGLTEAFRSSYVPPSMVDAKPDSMGIAIPSADLYVLNDQDQLCGPGERGQLVHAGELVAQGYWQQPQKTAQRFKALPAHIDSKQPKAVWSGDYVYQDEDGFLYFSGRTDNQLKVSGYRISPEEIEQVLMSLAPVKQAAVFGVPDPKTGQAIVAVVESNEADFDEKACIKHCRLSLAAYMQPTKVVIKTSLPTNPNGKLNRALIQEML